MTTYHRVTYLLVLLLFILLALALTIHSFGLVANTLYPDFLDFLYNNVGAGLVFAVLFLLGIWALTPYFLKVETAHTLIHEGELGEVRVSLYAIESLVQRVISEQKGIQDAKSHLKITADGLHILLRIQVSPQMDIPHVTSHLQESIRDFITRTAGVAVARVEIEVRNIAQDSQKPRVE